MKSLSDCRVLDLGIITAGAATSAILADLGADVVKIESPSYKDPFRRWSGQPFPGEHPDMPPFFRMTNRRKWNVAIDLKNPKGREVFLHLVSRSDVVVENFSRGVLDRLNLTYPTMRDANPQIILASISSQGDDGPDERYVSFGSTLEAMAGLAALTGYRAGRPEISGVDYNYPDQVVAVFVASMIATAWYARQNGAGGVHLDLSQRELTSFLAGEAFLSRSPPERIGNGQTHALFQDCYRTRDNVWLAVTVLDADRAAVVELAGNHDEVSLQNWIGAEDSGLVLSRLREVGIAAEPALKGPDVLAERDAGWSRAIAFATDGDLVKGVLFDDLAKPVVAPRPTAHFAADTEGTLMRIGGYSADDIRALAATGAIALRETPPDQRRNKRQISCMCGMT